MTTGPGLPAPSLPSPAPLPTQRELLRVWLGVGMQSFGGGAVTLALIRRLVVQQRAWLTEAEFVRDWALCQMSPGINLLGLTVLIGRRLGGAWGIALALSGLLLPSVTMTVAITASYLHFQHNTFVRHAVQGIVPGAVGVGLLTAGQMAGPLLAAARREGRSMLGLAIALLAGGAAIAAVGRVPTLAILCGAGVIGALCHWGHDRRRAARGRVRR